MATASPRKRIILVTGANRGIGLAIIQNLTTDPRAAIVPTTYLMGTRSLANGKEAVASLRASHPEITAEIVPIEVDVDSDLSILEAARKIRSEYGYLDVLVNNSGQAVIPPTLPLDGVREADLQSIRDSFSRTINTNVTSVYVLTSALAPLLKNSSTGGLVIMVSSTRGSIAGLLSGALPRTVVIPYSTSKTAMNALTIHLAQQPANEGIRFEIVSPGHCKTAFNGYRGTRDPLEGADVVTALVYGDRNSTDRDVGFWETKGDSKELIPVPW